MNARDEYIASLNRSIDAAHAGWRWQISVTGWLLIVIGLLICVGIPVAYFQGYHNGLHATNPSIEKPLP